MSDGEISVGDRVSAKVPVGEHGETRPFKGTIDKVMVVDGFGKAARVCFDDALIYGGSGRVWVPTTEIERLE